MSFLTDLASLEVITVTGQINVKGKQQSGSAGSGAGKPATTTFSFEDLFTNDKGKITIQSNLKVIAASKIHVDHDTFTFVADQLDDADKDLVALHMQSVDAALAGRANIIAKIKPSLEIIRPGKS